MKSLVIKSDVCLLSKQSYSTSINEVEIGKLVQENLPEELEEYKKYPVKLKVEIEFLGEDGLSVTTEGYEVKKEESEDEE